MPNKITHLNKAEGSFLVEKYLSTKEKRGIPSRSRYILYDKTVSVNNISTKIVFLFLHLANTYRGHNFIFHIGVYQGKNKNNMSIPPDLEFSNSTESICEGNCIYRIISRPKCIQRTLHGQLRFCTRAFITLKMRYKILSCGTVCTYTNG